jgi:hypothetical protein
MVNLLPGIQISLHATEVLVGGGEFFSKVSDRRLGIPQHSFGAGTVRTFRCQ